MTGDDAGVVVDDDDDDADATNKDNVDANNDGILRLSDTVSEAGDRLSARHSHRGEPTIFS